MIRQHAWRIVNCGTDLSKDLHETKKLLSLQSEYLKKLLLCCSEQKKIIVRDKPDSEPREFNKEVEFKLLTGKKYSDCKEIVQLIQKCLLKYKANPFAINSHKIFFNDTNITFGKKNDKIYKNNYESFCKLENKEIDHIVFTKAKVFKIKDKITGEKKPGEKTAIITKPHATLYMHCFKHLASCQNELFPCFKTKNENIEKNSLFNVCSELKDFTRKNQDCLDDYNNHEKLKQNKFNEFKKNEKEFDQLQALLIENNWNLKDHFKDNWENKFLDFLRENKEIKTNYPEFIFKFLNENKHLWEKEDIFGKMVDYCVLNNTTYKDHAVQPLYSSLDIWFGAGLLKWNMLKIEDRYLYAEIELLSGKHYIECHIPKKYRDVKLISKSNTIKNTTKFEIEYTDEKDFKRKLNIRKKAIINSSCIRIKTGKHRKHPCYYLYVPLNLPMDMKKFENKVGDRVLFVDLGTNELIATKIGIVSDKENTTLYGNPKGIISNEKIDNSQIIETNTEFVKKMKSIDAYMQEIKDWKKAIVLFTKKAIGKTKSVNEKLEKLNNDFVGHVSRLNSMYHRLNGKYNKLLKQRSKEKFTLWEDAFWIKLSIKKNSLLTSYAFKGKTPNRFKEKIDYSSISFSQSIKRHNESINNQKEDLRKKLGSWLNDVIVKYDIKCNVTENLGFFTQDRKNDHKMNKLLQIWGHRTLLKKLNESVETCGVESIQESVDNRYNSQIDPPTGNFLYRHKGSKDAITQDLKKKDADGEIACVNIARRFFLKSSDKELYPDVVFREDYAVSRDDGTVFIQESNVWKKTDRKETISKNAKYERLFKWGNEYFNRKEHNEKLRSIGKEYEKIKNVK